MFGVKKIQGGFECNHACACLAAANAFVGRKYTHFSGKYLKPIAQNALALFNFFDCYFQCFRFFSALFFVEKIHALVHSLDGKVALALELDAFFIQVGRKPLDQKY